MERKSSIHENPVSVSRKVWMDLLRPMTHPLSPITSHTLTGAFTASHHNTVPFPSLHCPSHTLPSLHCFPSYSLPSLPIILSLSSLLFIRFRLVNSSFFFRLVSTRHCFFVIVLGQLVIVSYWCRTRHCFVFILF